MINTYEYIDPFRQLHEDIHGSDCFLSESLLS